MNMEHRRRSWHQDQSNWIAQTSPLLVPCDNTVRNQITSTQKHFAVREAENAASTSVHNSFVLCQNLWQVEEEQSLLNV